MAESNSPAIRTVVWSEVFPCLNIVRAFRLAISLRSLVLGAIGILLTVFVWGVIGMVFGDDTPATKWLEPLSSTPWSTLTSAVPDRPGVAPLPDAASSPVVRSWAFLSSPAVNGLNETGCSVRSVACIVLCGLWAAAVWAFFGAAICRTAAVRLAADEQVGVGAAIRFASRKWPSYFFAPILPVIGVAGATFLIFLLGLFMRVNAGMVLAGFLWPLVLVAGFLMAVLLLGLLFGWPLMWAAISVEGTDSFDALSRTYAYVFQRPLKYLFYVLVAGVVGWLGWILVREFAAGIVWLGYWGAGWGCGRETIAAILNPDLAPKAELNGAGQFGAGMIRFWAGCVKMLAVGYTFSYLWTAAASVYLQLRRDVDAAETDEVFLDADATEEEPSLPAVGDNGAGDAAAADVK